MIQPLRIAVADDEPDIRQYFRRLLPRLGYEVVGEAENGMELVELCRTTKPDLVITDVMMPEMTGIEAAAEISKTQSIPIIVLSSHERPAVDNNAEKVMRDCVVDYLRKPVSSSELQASITKACNAL